MQTPLISVLIPTYNVEKYIEQAIDSIINQTYTNLEIIVVDDCSQDKTFTILSELASKDQRIKLFRNKSNQKIVETLNFAIQQATGDYYARMDGDDISLPDRFEKQLHFLQENVEIGLVGLNVIMIDEEDVEIHKHPYPTSWQLVKETAKYVSPIPHFWMAKKEVYSQIGSYRIPTAEDLDFILRCIDFGLKLANLPDYVYLQRVREGNTSTSSGLKQQKSIAYVRKLHNERIDNATMGDSYSFEALNKVLSTNSIEKFMYKQSSFFHHKYIISKGRKRLTGLFHRAMSIIFYPRYQLKEVYNRRQYKKLLKVKRQ